MLNSYFLQVFINRDPRIKGSVILVNIHPLMLFCTWSHLLVVILLYSSTVIRGKDFRWREDVLTYFSVKKNLPKWTYKNPQNTLRTEKKDIVSCPFHLLPSELIYFSHKILTNDETYWKLKSHNSLEKGGLTNKLE